MTDQLLTIPIPHTVLSVTDVRPKGQRVEASGGVWARLHKAP